MVERIYYDGECGVCHWAVRFVARHDRAHEDGAHEDGAHETGAAEQKSFRFAPLNGLTFEQSFPQIVREDLPDSMLVETADGRLLMRSDGIAHILDRLGGIWTLLGRLLGLIPRLIRDTGYDLFARIRYLVASKPEGVCPILPDELRGRFDP